MTDHKANVRCLQDFAAAYDADSENGRALRAAIAALTAAPQPSLSGDGGPVSNASEGEDGAVGEICSGPFGVQYVALYAGTNLTPGTKLYTRPAAQVAATPEHDEGRDASLAIRTLARDIQHAIADDGYAPQSPADYNGMRESIIRALATQPAARRVSGEGVTVDPSPVRDFPEAHVVRFRVGARVFCIGDVFYTKEAAEKMAEAFRAALESFAQPAEGVSE